MQETIHIIFFISWSSWRTTFVRTKLDAHNASVVSNTCAVIAQSCIFIKLSFPQRNFIELVLICGICIRWKMTSISAIAAYWPWQNVLKTVTKFFISPIPDKKLSFKLASWTLPAVLTTTCFLFALFKFKTTWCGT